MLSKSTMFVQMATVNVNIAWQEINIQNQPRIAYEAVYRREPAARYQPQSWARRAARRLISGWRRASIHRPSTPSKVGCVFIIP